MRAQGSHMAAHMITTSASARLRRRHAAQALKPMPAMPSQKMTRLPVS